MIFRIKLLKSVFNVVFSEKSILLQTGLQISSVRAGNWLSSHWHLTGCLFSCYNNCQLSTNFSSHRNNEGHLWWTTLSRASLWQFLYIHIWYWLFISQKRKKNEDNQCKMLSRVEQREDKGVCMLFSTWLWKPSPNKDGMSAQMLFFFFFNFKKALQLEDKM